MRKEIGCIAGLALILSISLSDAYAVKAQTILASADSYIKVLSALEDKAGNFLLLKFKGTSPLRPPQIHFLPSPEGKTIMVADFENVYWTRPPQIFQTSNKDIDSVRLGLFQSNPPVFRISIASSNPAMLRKIEFVAKSDSLLVRLRSKSKLSSGSDKGMPPKAPPYEAAALTNKDKGQENIEGGDGKALALSSLTNRGDSQQQNFSEKIKGRKASTEYGTAANTESKNLAVVSSAKSDTERYALRPFIRPDHPGSDQATYAAVPSIERAKPEALKGTDAGIKQSENPPHYNDRATTRKSKTNPDLGELANQNSTSEKRVAPNKLAEGGVQKSVPFTAGGLYLGAAAISKKDAAQTAISSESGTKIDTKNTAAELPWRVASDSQILSKKSINKVEQKNDLLGYPKTAPAYERFPSPAPDYKNEKESSVSSSGTERKSARTPGKVSSNATIPKANSRNTAASSVSALAKDVLSSCPIEPRTSEGASPGGANTISAGGAKSSSAGGANTSSAGGANAISAGGANTNSAGGAAIENPEISIEGTNPLSVKICFHSETAYSSFKLDNPPRYVLDFAIPMPNPRLPPAPLVASKNKFLKGIRFGVPDVEAKTTRIVLDLEDECNSIKEQCDISKRALLITLDSNTDKTGQAKSILSVKGKVVVIDPGHGGSDPGAQRGEIQEKEMTLAIALKLKKALEEKGLRVVMTRTDDTFVSLEDRVRITNEVKPDAFVSVHINSLETDRDIQGIETYYQTSQSKILANKIHEQLVSKLAVPDRYVRKARFYVVNHTSHPAVLAEVGFISNKDERDKLISSEYQIKVADSIGQGVVSFLSEQMDTPVNYARQAIPSEESASISATSALKQNLAADTSDGVKRNVREKRISDNETSSKTGNIHSECSVKTKTNQTASAQNKLRTASKNHHL